MISEIFIHWKKIVYFSAYISKENEERRKMKKEETKKIKEENEKRN